MALPIGGAEGCEMDLWLQAELESGVSGGVWGLCLWAGWVLGMWGWAGVVGIAGGVGGCGMGRPLLIPSPSVTVTAP